MLRLIVTRNFATAASKIPPLAGLTVVDLTRILAGPFTTMLLGDLGARVIKIEHPEGGDETRRWAPPYVPGTKESCYFMSVNRNKQSMTVNIQNKEGQEILRKLVGQADILVENFIPGKLDKYGLGYDDLKAVNRKLIYCSISGFGSEGPYSRRAGYDVMAACIGGLVALTGPEGGEPCKVGVAITDLCTGLYAHGAIMAALLHRQKTGDGQWIQANLLATQVSCMANLASNYLNAGLEGERRGTAHESIVPYQAFKCADGRYLACGALSESQFKNFCDIIGCNQLIDDVRFKTNPDRVKNRKELIGALSAKFEEKTVDEWTQKFESSGLPYGPVNSLSHVFADPQVQFLRMAREVEHPTAGTVKFPGPAVRYSESDCDVRSAPPTLGQHTGEVLKELGFSEPQIAKFRSNGVV